MSVVGIAQELPDSPSVVWGLNEREYTRKFRVQTSSVADGPLTVLTAPGLPLMFSAYQFGNDIPDAYALLPELKADRMGPAQLYWTVTATYKSPKVDEDGRPSGGERDQPGSNDNPLLVLPEVETTMERYEEVVWWTVSQGPLANIAIAAAQAVGGAANVIPNPNPFNIQPCRNSAGMIFDPPPTKDASRISLSITRNEAIATAHPSIDIKYSDAINSDVFWGSPPGTWKCMGISSRRETKQTSNGSLFPYIRVSYKFQARQTWMMQLLDAGTFYINANGQKITCRTQDSQQCTLPLNGKGGLLTAGAAPVFLQLQPYNSLPFGALNLPQSFLQIA